jgi:hypothetical protein
MLMKSKSALKAEVEAMSEPRRRLAEMITERDKIHDRISALNAQNQRLSGAQDYSAIEAELSALNAKESAEIAAWSRTGGAVAPKVDVSKRDEINSQLSAARATADAARNAAIPVAAEIDREHEALRRIGVPIQIAISEIIAAEVEPLFADYTAANNALAAKRSRIQCAAQTILGIGESIGRKQATGSGTEDFDRAAAQPIFRTLEILNGELAGLFGNPPPPNEHEAAAAWQSLSGRLNADATAKLEI